jgi:hypothetical protein
MIKTLNMFFFIFGIILIVVGYTHNIKEVCHPRIEYRFIPKNTYDDLLYDNDNMETIWKDLRAGVEGEGVYYNSFNIKPYNDSII